MLTQKSKGCLGNRDRIGRVHPEFREGRGVECLPRVVYVKHGSGDNFRTEHVKRCGMHHHSGVNAIKSAALELQNLATGVAHFFGRSADNGYGETDLVCHLGAATAAPTAEAAMILWPQAWPISGRQSYSAQIPMFKGPDPARARNAVGKSQIPFSTEKPASVSDSHSQDDAFSSSKPSSGCAWIRWLSSIKLLRASSKRSRAPDFAFMADPFATWDSNS